MTEEESLRIVGLIMNEAGKVLSDDKLDFWTHAMRKLPFRIGMLAAREMLKEKIYGEPQFSMFRDHALRTIRALRIAKSGDASGPINHAELVCMSPEAKQSYLVARKLASQFTPLEATELLSDVEQAKALAQSERSDRQALEDLSSQGIIPRVKTIGHGPEN